MVGEAFPFPESNFLDYTGNQVFEHFLLEISYDGKLRCEPVRAVKNQKLINYFFPKIIVFYIFTGQTGSLRQEPDRCGSPGRAVLVHIIMSFS